MSDESKQLTIRVEASQRDRSLPRMSDAERAAISILLVETEDSVRVKVKNLVREQGYGLVLAVNDHLQALQKLKERHFSHLIFNARSEGISIDSFLLQALELEPEIIAIPASQDPTMDKVFELLVDGARSYLVKPFTDEVINEVLVLATKGKALPDAVLQSRDRNRAFSIYTAATLDSLTTLLRQARTFETARHEVPLIRQQLHSVVRVARMFARDGEHGLLESFEEYFTECASKPASRLGRKRYENQQRRKKRVAHQAL